ncbi:MAG: hypothetical protein ACR2H3_11700 [Acidimicrobiales bacterium]
MTFTQIIEFSTTRIDAFNAEFDAWKAHTEGPRIPHRAVLSRDRDVEDGDLVTLQFSSYDVAMANSARPETAAFAAFLSRLSTGPMRFRNLDVLRTEDL